MTSYQILQQFCSELCSESIDLPNQQRGTITQKILHVLKNPSTTLKHHSAPPTSSLFAANPSNALVLGQPRTANAKLELSADSLSACLRLQEQERLDLAQLFYLFSVAGLLPIEETEALAEHLSTIAHIDSITTYLFISFLGSLNAMMALMSEEETAQVMSQTAVEGTRRHLQNAKFQLNGMGAVTSLQWALFLIAAFKNTPELVKQSGISEGEIEKAVNSAISGGAFVFIKTLLDQDSMSGSDDPPIHQPGRDEQLDWYLRSQLDQVLSVRLQNDL